MTKIALIFGGQGSQKEKMGEGLKEFDKLRPLLAKLPKDIHRLLFEENMETLSRTENTQPALVAFEIMMGKMLRDLPVGAVGGLSIGEYSALEFSGVLSENEVYTLAKERGRAMAEASSKGEWGMSAILGLRKEEILSVIKEWEPEVYAANFNSPTQTVISGTARGVEKAVEKLRKNKARAIPLRVSGPFHTPFMAPVSERLCEIFKGYSFQDEKIPVYYNVLGDRREEEAIFDLMIRQVQEPVHFYQMIEAMARDGITTFVEVGFHEVIQGLIRRILPNARVYSITNYSEYERVRKELA